MTQGPRNSNTPLQALGYAEYTVNTLAESAKQYWRWWGPLGEPMIRAADEWAATQRKYLEQLRESQGTGSEGGGREAGAQLREPSWMAPLRDLAFDTWPGPGNSEGGGWDR